LFTFLTISYNQEKFIIQHLESIKYQIENFGENNDFKFILSDDCSKDRTVEFAMKWIELNSDLFNEVAILRSEKNEGIVANYFKGINAIDIDRFKCLAGDDLYYKNNIFEVEDNDLVFTPTIEFNDSDTVRINPLATAFLIQNKEIHRLRKLINYSNIFNAPGTFIKSKLIKDPQLTAFVSQYNWIEDYPTWHYIFNNVGNVSYSIKHIPYILYRTSIGISINENNQKYDEFTKERELMRKDLKMKLYKYPKYLNPFMYYWGLIKYKLKYLDIKINPEIREFNARIEKEISGAPEYISEIRNNANKFHEKIRERVQS